MVMYSSLRADITAAALPLSALAKIAAMKGDKNEHYVITIEKATELLNLHEKEVEGKIRDKMHGNYLGGSKEEWFNNGILTALEILHPELSRADTAGAT
jgi:hypothetical protein